MDEAPVALRDHAAIAFASFTLDIGHFAPTAPLTLLRGPNGSGKTTLLRALAGMLTLTQGARFVRPNTRIGYVPQTYRDALVPWMSATRNLGLLGGPAEQMGEYILRMGMSKEDMEKRPYELSGGQCQRLTLVRECFFRPTLLLLDEPFAALDVIVFQMAGELVERVIADGTRVVLATHDPLPDCLRTYEQNAVEITRTADTRARVND